MSQLKNDVHIYSIHISEYMEAVQLPAAGSLPYGHSWLSLCVHTDEMFTTHLAISLEPRRTASLIQCLQSSSAGHPQPFNPTERRQTEGSWHGRQPR